MWNDFVEPARLRQGDIIRLSDGISFVEQVNDCCARVRIMTVLEKRFVSALGNCLLRSDGPIIRISRNAEVEIIARKEENAKAKENNVTLPVNDPGNTIRKKRQGRIEKPGRGRNSPKTRERGGGCNAIAKRNPKHGSGGKSDRKSKPVKKGPK